MKTKFILFTLASLLISFFSCNKKEIKSFAPASQKTDALAEWESLRFGAFVHFNDNSCLVSEFSKNTDPAIFNPVNLDFDSMMATFQEAGVKYAVLTTRHTSGFCLWDSKVTQFDVAESPFKKDVVKLFVDACCKHDIKPCLYYCLWGSKDWNPVTWNPTIKAELEATTPKQVILSQLDRVIRKLRRHLCVLARHAMLGRYNAYTTGILRFAEKQEPKNFCTF